MRRNKKFPEEELALVNVNGAGGTQCLDQDNEEVNLGKAQAAVEGTCTLVETELLDKEVIPAMYVLLAKAEVENKASVIEAVVASEEEDIFNEARAIGVDPMGILVETKLVNKGVADRMGSISVAGAEVVDKAGVVEAVLVHQEQFTKDYSKMLKS